MKQLFLLFMTMIIFVQLIADGTPAEGSGTESDPYLIETLDNLLWLSTTDNVWGNNIYFLQTEDIDASDTQNWNDGVGFMPIGGFTNGIPRDRPNHFYGNYNGGNHIIDSLYINCPEGYHVGLFGYINGATIESLGVTNVNITGYKWVAALAAVNKYNSSISNCYASGSVNGDQIVGGLIGSSYESTVSECYATCSVTGNEFVGGLVGRDFHSSIYESYYDYETVWINNQHLISLGALTSELYNTWLNNDMTLDIVDYLTYDGDYYLINGFDDFEKLLAFGWNSENNFLLTTDFDLTDHPNFYIPSIKGSFNGDNHIIDGLNINSPTVDKIGLFGYTYGATIEALGVTNVNVIGFLDVGGLIGTNDYSTISDCFATGNMNGDSYIGGLVGANNHSTVSDCYATSIVDGFGQVGGLLGVNFLSSLSNSYKTGSVYGYYDAGGLVGKNDNSDISNCFSNGSIDGFNSNRLGGFVGYNISGATIDNCIWNIDNAGQTTGVGPQSAGTITGLLAATTAEMQLMSTYTDIGWDFVGETVNGTEYIWDINDALNNGYPYISDLEWSLNDDIYANFTATPVFGFTPLTVNFTDESISQSSTIVSWEWDFQNDGVIDSNEQNPEWLYNEQGIYSVSLTVSDELNRNISTIIKEDYIEIIDGSFVPEGSGTVTDPYLIATIDNLFWLSTSPEVWASSIYFKQTQDIDATDTQNWNEGDGFSPIGSFPLIPFQGSYNGDDYFIDGLYIHRPGELISGLFGYTSGAVIEALGVTNIDLTAYDVTGGLVGYNYNSVINECYTTGSVTGDSFVGGLVGNNDFSSVISECYATCSVSGVVFNIGGLVGFNSVNSSIISCYATGHVIGNYDHTGGLVGFNYENSTISNSYSTGSVDGDYYVGGLVGKNRDNSIISNCYSRGNVTCNGVDGGLVGFNENALIENCVWDMETSGQLFGVFFNQDGTIINLLGKTTAEMLIMSTYTDIGWDFVGENVNGTEDIWDIDIPLNNGFPYISELGWSVGGLNANFTAVPTYGIMPLTVNFTDQSVSSYPIVSWQWDFQNDNIIDSYEQNPVWIFTEPGIYSVSLTVSDDIERDTVTILKENYIEVISQIQYGDISDNAVVESYDASLLLMYLVGLDPLPEDPVPWEDWRIARADVDLNGECEALDAAYILQYVVSIITEFPVTRAGGIPDIAISLSNDSEYIYLNTENKIISLEYKIIASRNLNTGFAECDRVDCLYYQNKQNFALISAEGISGNILKIPYEKISNTDCSLDLELACNGFLENITYTLTDPVQPVTRLNSIYPNPFNPVTNIQYELAEDGKVIIDIYNIKGQKVVTLLNEEKEAGKHSIIWNADSRGSGVYLLKFKTGTMNKVRTLILLK
ncbi:MAG: PKD domain-containing protein [Candidatus Cloacimonetes bacterium]|nr:PKD domain-containing protein [Candidatus Cloacimonadota bacterium]